MVRVLFMVFVIRFDENAKELSSSQVDLGGEWLALGDEHTPYAEAWAGGAACGKVSSNSALLQLPVRNQACRLCYCVLTGATVC